MNCISVLQKIAEAAATVEGKPVAPVAWECNCLEEVCGACTMLINGRVRQACTALVDQLLAGSARARSNFGPMTKFPVLRDLVVDRSRMFASLEKIQAWLPVDSYLDMGSGPAAVAGNAADGLSVQQVHDLRLLPGGLPAVSEDRTGAQAGRDATSNTAPGSARRTCGRSWARTPSPRSSCSTPIRSAR